MLKSGMEIKNNGQNGLQIIGKKETVLVNPSGDTLKKSTSRVILYNRKVETGLLTMENKVLIIGPGEYEVGGVEINGHNDGEDGVVYSVVIDGIAVAILGSLKGELSEKKIDKIGSADVLLADIGGYGESQSKSLLKLAKKWGANYLLPYGQNEGGTETKDFLNVADNEGLEPVASLKIDKDTLPEGMETVLLKETA
jgi:hypothetical protein